MSIPPFLGLKRFTLSVAGPAAGGTLVAIILQALSAYLNAVYLNRKNITEECTESIPFLVVVSCYADQRRPRGTIRIEPYVIGHP